MLNLHVGFLFRKSLSSCCTAAVLSALLLTAFTACNGNGGSHDGGGEVYNQGMGGGNTGNTNTTASGGSAASGTSETFTAQDLWNFSNAGNSTKIIQLVTQADPASRTKTVSMSAADLGLPANGTVTLTITGSGIAFSETKSADADGYVRFEVPPVETDSTVAIELIVRAADGTVIYSGSKNLEVKEGSSADITLYRQAWTRATADRTVLTATASSADLATITITGATETPLLTPSSALLNIDPPMQDASNPQTYTVSVGIPGGTAPVWFADDTAVSVNVKIGTEEHTIAFTLKNKYTYYLKNHVGTGGTIARGPLDSGSTLAFTDAAAVVASYSDPIPTGRSVAVFKDEVTGTIYRKTDFPITFNSTNFSSRSIMFKAQLDFAYTISGGRATGAPEPAGTEADPFMLVFDSPDGELTCIDLTISDYIGTMSTDSNSGGNLTISGSDTDSPAITIASTVTYASIPTAGWKYKVTLTDSGTGVYKDLWVKVCRLTGSKTTPDAVGDIVFSDGSAEACTATLTDEQKNAAVAVIFDAANKKGVGLNVGTGKRWCAEDTIAYPVRTYATSFEDGKTNTEQIAGTDEIAGLSDYSEDNYPAFAYCRAYSVPGYTSGWYLPALNELLSLRTNKTAVEEAFSSLGKTSPFDMNSAMNRIYFASTQDDSDTTPHYGKFVYLLYSDTTTAGYGSTSKSNPLGNAIAVRVFD